MKCRSENSAIRINLMIPGLIKYESLTLFIEVVNDSIVIRLFNYTCKL